VKVSPSEIQKKNSKSYWVFVQSTVKPIMKPDVHRRGPASRDEATQIPSASSHEEITISDDSQPANAPQGTPPWLTPIEYSSADESFISGEPASEKLRATFLNIPRKRPEDYFEFIALDGTLAALDPDSAEFWFGREEANRCDAMARAHNGRWVLIYAPFPDSIPPWADSDSRADGPDQWEECSPPSRELPPRLAARWFQVINGYALPQGLEPVATHDESESGSPSRLDWNWRAQIEPIRQEPTTKTTATAGKSSKIKEPSKEALAAYRLSVLKGSKQQTIAETLSKVFHRPISQGQISRMINQAKKWIAAGNVLPGLEEATSPDPNAMRSRHIAMDPRKLDQGPRLDRRSRNQRPYEDDG
jgi:hypothetical protein